MYKATTRVFGGDEMGINNIEIEKIIEILIANFNPYLIYFFGSVLTDTFREDSDIDIAFLSDSKISDYDVFIIAQNIADIVNRDVDLINLKNSSTVFKAQVIGNGKVIFCNDNNRRMFFEMRSFKEYTLLNEERQVILDNIKKRVLYMGNDVLYNKIDIIERCIKRINEEYENNPNNLKNYTKQDSIILNIQRACEASIDLAMHVVSEKKLGIPQNSRDAFEVLNSNNIISNSLTKKLKAMIGFRNIAVHNYQAVNLNVIQEIIHKHLKDLTEFTEIIVNIK